MDWFFATRLRPHLLYDGKENAFSKWMRDRGVKVINLETPFLNDFPEIAKPLNESERSALRGTFF